jgi:hypothetical protein
LGVPKEAGTSFSVSIRCSGLGAAEAGVATVTAAAVRAVIEARTRRRERIVMPGV